MKRGVKMLSLIKGFLSEEDGMGTVEIVVIIAVLLAVALLFSGSIKTFVGDLMKKFFVVPSV